MSQINSDLAQANYTAGSKRWGASVMLPKYCITPGPIEECLPAKRGMAEVETDDTYDDSFEMYNAHCTIKYLAIYSPYFYCHSVTYSYRAQQ